MIKVNAEVAKDRKTCEIELEMRGASGNILHECAIILAQIAANVNAHGIIAPEKIVDLIAVKAKTQLRHEGKEEK